MSNGERTFVRWLADRPGPPQVRLGIGDDMCVLRVGQSDVLVTTDLLLDGVHFDTARHAPAQIGRKALACGLSDCAAMAVRPVAATVSLALPREYSISDAQALYEGMEPLAKRYDCPITGGDTNSWDHPLVIDVAVLATPYAGHGWVTRSRAGVGDRLFITGPLGGSLKGRHMTFEPRVETAYRLLSTFGERLHAMMDISDGLSLDLHRLCEASGVGAQLREPLLLNVAHVDAEAASAEDGRPVVDHVLGDGEDFELLLALAKDADPDSVDVPLLPIGQITPSDLVVTRLDGSIQPLPISGFEHSL